MTRISRLHESFLIEAATDDDAEATFYKLRIQYNPEEYLATYYPIKKGEMMVKIWKIIK